MKPFTCSLMLGRLPEANLERRKHGWDEPQRPWQSEDWKDARLASGGTEEDHAKV